MSVDVAKHQQGKHDQSAHGAWAKGSGLREGWSQRSKDQILAEFQTRFRGFYPNDREHADNMAEEFASWTTKYDGPNGTVVTVDLRTEYGDDKSPDPQTMDTVLWTLDRLQAQNPVKDLQVEFSDGPFRDEADIIPEHASGFVIRGEKKINLRPRYATDLGMSQVRDDGHFMPAAQGVSAVEYYLTHEYGHVRDTRGRGQVADDIYRLDYLETSGYGASNEYEKYAEAYTEWSLTNGETTNETAQTYAKKYFWADNMQKAAGDDEIERVIIIDTFDAANPPSVRPYEKQPTPTVIKIAPHLRPLLKHMRGIHDQKTHGRDRMSPSETDYQEQLADIDYMMGYTPFPPDYSYEGIGPKTVTLREVAREQIQKARRAIKEWKKERESRYLENLSAEDKKTLIAANRARVDAWRASQGLPPVVYKSMDPVLPLLYDIFRDVVDDPAIWLALVNDPRPLVEIDGDLGVLLDEMLEAVAPLQAVIKLAPGLRPVLKHQRGKHDQRSHGVWARGRGGAGGDFSEWGDRAARIREVQDIGPDLSAVARTFQAIEDGTFDSLVEERILDDYSEMIEFDINDQREYIQSQAPAELMDLYGTPARLYVDALVAQGQTEAAAIEKFRDMKMFEVEQQVKAQAVIDYRYEVTEKIRDDLISDVAPRIMSVMEISHPVSVEGVADHINVEITELDIEDFAYGRPVITIKGTLTNDYGITVGHDFHREIRLAEDSTRAAPKLEAENKYLKITDDRYQRQGFATAFNERTYDMYIANGMDTVKVGTAWDGGAVWAKRGFDWDGNYDNLNMSVARDALNSVIYDDRVTERTRGRASDMLEATFSASGVSDVDMPTPMEIVMLGYTPGVSRWPGYDAMFDSRWQGIKILEPSSVGDKKARKDELKEIARREQETAGQKKLFTLTEQPSATGTIGEPVSVGTQEILDLLEPVGGVPRVRTPEGAAKYGKPIGAPIVAKKKMTRWDKLQAQMDFYENWLKETNRELDDDDPEAERDFFAAAAEAMPWLVD